MLDFQASKKLKNVCFEAEASLVYNMNRYLPHLQGQVFGIESISYQNSVNLLVPKCAVLRCTFILLKNQLHDIKHA